VALRAGSVCSMLKSCWLATNPGRANAGKAVRPIGYSRQVVHAPRSARMISSGQVARTYLRSRTDGHRKRVTFELKHSAKSYPCPSAVEYKRWSNGCLRAWSHDGTVSGPAPAVHGPCGEHAIRKTIRRQWHQGIENTDYRLGPGAAISAPAMRSCFLICVHPCFQCLACRLRFLRPADRQSPQNL
jgi:hypothetical protein